MRRVALLVIVAVALGLASSALRADVKTQEKTLVKFEGMLGRMVGLFGGKAAKEGIVNTIAVQGNRKATMSETGGQIIDLGEEKIYDINVKGKSYEVLSFAEFRRRLEEAKKKAEEQARKTEERKESEAPQFELDVDVKPTGEARAINGFDCKQTIVTITVRQKGKTLADAGGMVLTADLWLAPTVAAMKEVADFDRRFIQKLGIDTLASAEQMAAAMSMFPGFGEAMSKFGSQRNTLDGTPILSTVKMENVKGAAQAAQAEKQEERPSGGIGGMFGGLGKRLGKKKDEEGTSGTPGRSTVMTSTTELLSVATTVSAADVAMPAGFRQK